MLIMRKKCKLWARFLAAGRALFAGRCWVSGAKIPENASFLMGDVFRLTPLKLVAVWSLMA